MLLKKVWLHRCCAWQRGICLASADVVELKDGAAISGKILTEKRESVVVDVGYTALGYPQECGDRIISGEPPLVAKPSTKEKKSTSCGRLSR
jgi:hypothetical protein